MAVSARASRALHQALGNEAGEEVVNWMSEMEINGTRIYDRVGSQSERAIAGIDACRVELRSEIHAMASELRSELQARGSELRSELQAQGSDLRSEMHALGSALRASIAEIRAEIKASEAAAERRYNDLLKWSFVFWVGAVGAIAALAGVLR